MANRLRDRNSQIPNGYKFRLASAKWEAAPWSSFQSVVDQVLRVVQGNPALAQKHNWPVTRQDIENWVESYNVKLCELNGWTNYLISDQAGIQPPKILPPQTPVARFARLAAGASTLMDWLGEGGVPVAAEVANKRAEICVTCPQNKKGDLTSWFTVPASELIRRQIQKRSELSLATVHDEELNICEACGCPLKLKVHVPLEDIERRIPAESRAGLDPRCWILKRDQPATEPMLDAAETREPAPAHSA